MHSPVSTWTTYLDGYQRRQVTYLVADFLLEDGSVLLVAAAAREQSGKQQTGERRVAEIRKRQVAELLKDRGHVAGLDHHLQKQKEPSHFGHICNLICYRQSCKNTETFTC